MTHPIARTIAALAAALLMNAMPVSASPSCEQAATRAQALLGEQDAEALRQLSRDSIGCDQATIEYVGQATALTMWNALLERAANATDPAAFEPDLRAILEFGQVWQAQEVLGDIAAARKDHVEATRAYQAALVALDDPNWTPNPPAEAVIAALFRKAETQRLLAPTYVANARTRDNKPAGLGATKISRFGAAKVAVPITFEFAKASFTLEGEKAAEDLLRMLKAQSPERVTLVGHTDPVGSDAANQVLSERRAKAVADWLRANGYSGTIITLGKGRSEPYKADDPLGYSQAELHQMSRRVELIR